MVIVIGITWNVQHNANRTYYVYINYQGEVERDNLRSSSILGFYRYKIIGYDSEGNKKNLDFMTNYNLRLHSYFKIDRDIKSGEVSWTEISREYVPENALINLDGE